MSGKLKIYLDTSVPNFLYADDSPEKKDITTDFFENFIKTGVYDCFVSPVVIAEIQDTTNAEKREQLFNVITTYPIEIIDYNSNEEKEIQMLAEHYTEQKIIPENKIADALHIAISTIKGMNYLVSWNYKHLANINKEHKIKLANKTLGYTSELRIITPLELLDYGI